MALLDFLPKKDKVLAATLLPETITLTYLGLSHLETGGGANEKGLKLISKSYLVRKPTSDVSSHFGLQE